MMIYRVHTWLLTLIAVGSLGCAPASVGTQAGGTTAQRWTPPRTPDGQPDVQGHFEIEERFGASRLAVSLDRITDERFSLGIERARLTDGKGGQGYPGAVVDPPDGQIPYQPWARTLRDERMAKQAEPPGPEWIDPGARCMPSGSSRPHWRTGGYWQILQPAGHVVFMYEYDHAYRIIPLDNRPKLGSHFKLWFGDSRGRWEGNTLVVETNNFNGRPWLDVAGNHYSDSLRLVERFTFDKPDSVSYKGTFEDPKVYTRPWTIAIEFLRKPKAENFELVEYACWEGERDFKGMLRTENMAKPK